MVHVPYKGGGPAVQSVLAGDTQLSFATPPSVLPLVNAGRLARAGGHERERTPWCPEAWDAEAGLPDYEISFWYGFFVPAGTAGRGREAPVRYYGRRAAERGSDRALAKEGTETSGSRSPQDFAAFPGRGYTALDAPGEGVRREAD